MRSWPCRSLRHAVSLSFAGTQGLVVFKGCHQTVRLSTGVTQHQYNFHLWWRAQEMTDGSFNSTVLLIWASTAFKYCRFSYRRWVCKSISLPFFSAKKLFDYCSAWISIIRSSHQYNCRGCSQTYVIFQRYCRETSHSSIINASQQICRLLNLLWFYPSIALILIGPTLSSN